MVLFPDRLAFLQPVESKCPPWELFPGIPFSLAEMQKGAWREAITKAFDQRGRKLLFVGTDSVRIPLGGVGIVHRNKGGFPANGEPDILLNQFCVHLFPELVNGHPLFLAIGFRDAWRFQNAGDRHLVGKRSLAEVDRAANGRGGERMRGASQRNMSLSGEEAGSGVKPNPSCTWEIGFHPGMQIGEVRIRARRPIQGFHIGHELN